MKKTFSFGKINYTNKSRRINAVEITVELRDRAGYLALAIRGAVWNASHTDVVMCGQCLDSIAEYRDRLSDPELFDQLYELWQKYHLHAMHAGTPEQEQAIEAWKAEGNRYDYKAVCDMLKARGLYEVNYTGLSSDRRYENEPYKYGHGWLVQELPGDVLVRVEHMLST